MALPVRGNSERSSPYSAKDLRPVEFARSKAWHTRGTSAKIRSIRLPLSCSDDARLAPSRRPKALADPARSFPPLAPLDKDYRRCHHDCCRYKTKRFQRQTEPMKQQKIAHPDGNCGHDDDEERAVHSKIVHCVLEPNSSPSKLSPISRRSRIGLPNGNARDPRALGQRVHLPRGFVIKIFREIFRRRIDNVKRRLIVQEFVIHAGAQCRASPASDA